MFTKIDLLVGAVGIRLSRKLKKIRNIPDVVFVKGNLAFGGYTPYEELRKRTRLAGWGRDACLTVCEPRRS